MMLKETKTKIEDTFDKKDIETFLKVLNTISEEKIGIADLRAYIQDRMKAKQKDK